MGHVGDAGTGDHDARMGCRALHGRLDLLVRYLPGENERLDGVLLEHQVVGDLLPGLAGLAGRLGQGHTAVPTGAGVADDLITLWPELVLQMGQGAHAGCGGAHPPQDRGVVPRLNVHRQHHHDVGHAGGIEIGLYRQVDLF